MSLIGVSWLGCFATSESKLNFLNHKIMWWAEEEANQRFLAPQERSKNKLVYLTNSPTSPQLVLVRTWEEIS